MAIPQPARAPAIDRKRYAALAFCWGDLLFELDTGGTVVFCAGPALEFTGVTSDDLVGTAFENLVAPADAPILAGFLKAIRNRVRVDGELIRLRRGATLLPVRVAGYCMDERSYVALRLQTGGAVVVEPPFGGLRDRDSFAQLAGRRIKELEQRGERAEMTVLGVAGLTDLSETLPEREQTALLAAVGACLSRNSLAGETATRIGGDAFGLVHNAALDLALLQAQLLEAARSAAPQVGYALAITHSTMIMDAAKDVSERDLAKGLLHAIGSFQKRSGDEFNIGSLTDNLSSLIFQGITDMRDFRRVLSARSFAMALQPIIDTRSGAVHHFEALCRFNAASPEESPYRHITFAE
ncbi:MAG: hypothetical protein WCK65_16090, partial [Rhodospirillaceae bacterium]